MGLLLMSALLVSSQDGNRLVYLDEADPYYVSRTFPKLTTPQWVGEEGVEAAVVLAIDDMRGHEKWEAYLRPILDRLKKSQGRASVSIMTCKIDPQHPHLRSWLAEGLSLECHTVDHPCPLLQGGDFAKAKSTYDRCVDMMASIPGNRPVAFRMPCCDSMNTPSPRFYAEIFNRATERGNFLTIDTSVFNVTTSADPELPRELVVDAGGKERVRKYLPFPSFVNTIENYPYPYVIGRLCWQFPCAVPSDWEAQNIHKPGNPVSVADMKAVIDATVLKQGTFNFVFHPYNWILNEQVNELIDHVEKKHGPKARFLTFREAQDRIDRHLLGGHPIRRPDGGDNGVRLLDLNNDGFLDVVIGNEKERRTRLWSPATRTWTEGGFPAVLAGNPGARFGILRKDGHPSLLVKTDTQTGAWHFDGKGWTADATLLAGLDPGFFTAQAGIDRGVRFRDLDRDGRCELLLSNERQQAAYGWSDERNSWVPLPGALPPGTRFVDFAGVDQGLRFVDLDGDGKDDAVFSNDRGWSVHVFKGLAGGWDTARSGARGDRDAIPPIVRGASNNGAWFHSAHLWVQNEDTAAMKDKVDRRTFSQLLGR
jgi:hypothetical protein